MKSACEVSAVREPIARRLLFLAYIFLSRFLPRLSPRVCVIGNFDMADVSDPKIQEGSFLDNVEQRPTMMMIPNDQTLFSQHTSTFGPINQIPIGCCLTTRHGPSLHTIPQEPLGRADYATTQNDRSDKLGVTKTGSGGLSELSEVLEDSRASFAYARVSYSNDKESQREKFILVVWIGKNTKVMRKAKARFFFWFTNWQKMTVGPDIRSLRRC